MAGVREISEFCDNNATVKRNFRREACDEPSLPLSMLTEPARDKLLDKNLMANWRLLTSQITKQLLVPW